jgi:hypothetical protein
VGKSEGKRPLARHRGRCKDKSKLHLRVIEWGAMDWINLAQVRDQ